MSENKVTEIQKQSFKDLYLTHINLSKNMISKFESNSFENCANMTKLDLSNNLIELFPKSTFDENSYATELALSFNLFTDLSQVRFNFISFIGCEHILPNTAYANHLL